LNESDDTPSGSFIFPTSIVFCTSNLFMTGLVRQPDRECGGRADGRGDGRDKVDSGIYG
jgi:hypothetical protein